MRSYIRMESSASTSVNDPILSPLLQALNALYSGRSDKQTKVQAGQFLEQFQKSVSTTIVLLLSAILHLYYCFVLSQMMNQFTNTLHLIA